MLIKYGANVDVYSIQAPRATPLVFASFKGHLDAVKVLVEEGNANVNLEMKDELRRPAIMIALGQRFLEIVRYLAQNGVDTNEQFSTGKVTLLGGAAVSGYLEVFELLIFKYSSPRLIRISRNLSASRSVKL